MAYFGPFYEGPVPIVTYENSSLFFLAGKGSQKTGNKKIINWKK